MVVRTAYSFMALILALTAFTGCASLNGRNETVEILTPEAFYVGTTKANIRFESGRYSNLYVRDSYSVWNGPPMRENPIARPGLEPDGNFIPEKYLSGPLVFDCYIGSTFPDSSIAYDLVKLRNLEVFLEIEGENKVLPVGIELVTEADEKSVGALRQFRRHVRLTFPSKDVQTGEPILDSQVGSLSLAIEGFDSKYVFKWMNASPALTLNTEIERVAPIVEWAKSKETYQVMKARYQEMRSRL